MIHNLSSDDYTDLQQYTILYVEDDGATQETLASMLENYFKQVIVARDGQEAWEIFQTQHIDIVLSDIVMPNLDGIGLLRHIRTSAQKDTPTILISAITDTHYFLDAIKLQSNGYVLKPIKFNELLQSIAEAILPFSQRKKIERNNQILLTLNAFFGGKRVEIVQYLFEHCDDSQIFYGAHEEIADALGTTRQTVAQCIKELINIGILTKIKNKTYKIEDLETLNKAAAQQSQSSAI